MSEQGDEPGGRFRPPRYLPQFLTIVLLVLAGVGAYVLLQLR